jgi:hypothetical protein
VCGTLLTQANYPQLQSNVGQPGWQPAWGVPYDARKLNTADLQTFSSGQCNFIPDTVIDNFQAPDLNLNYWIPTGTYAYPFTNTQDPTLPSGPGTNSYNGSLSSMNPVYVSTGNVNYKYTSYMNTPWGIQQAGGNQDHCPSAGAVGAASPGTCTYLNPQSFQSGIDIGYTAQSNTATATSGVNPAFMAEGDTSLGARLTLTQRFCYNDDGSNSDQCCSPQPVPCTSPQKAAWIALGGGNTASTCPATTVNVCASWSGGHLSSQFCPDFGIVEAEAAFNMPAEGGAFMFFGTYMYGTAKGSFTPSYGGAAVTGDPSWNEVDELIYNTTTNGLGQTTTGTASYGTSLFVSQPPPALASKNQGFGSTQAQGLASNHDSTGSCANTGCVASQQSAGTCTNAPLGYPAGNATLTKLGVPSTVAGGMGCPAYTSQTMSTFNNYKVIWTPNWCVNAVDYFLLRPA